MNPQLMKLLARLKGMGAEGVKMADKGMGMAGAGLGSAAGMAARNPKTSAGLGLGAAGLGAGAAAMGDEEDDSEIEMDPEALMQLIEQLKGQGGNMMKKGRAALGM